MIVVPRYNAQWHFMKRGSLKGFQEVCFHNHKQLTADVDHYFLEESLYSGKEMTLEVSGDYTRATLLSRQVADSIPFSSNKLPDILDEFSIEPGSIQAEAIEETITACERSTEDNEEEAMHCTTSLESMIDWSISKLGKNITAVGTEVDGENRHKNHFTISRSSGVKQMGEGNQVVCHGMTYPYAVYYCHVIHGTRSYMVPMVAADGTKAKAVAVCHIDTKEFSPDHVAFKLLNVKPGSVPVCHFLPDDTIFWFPN
ncbi:PREDICTED: BURP domain protein RD22-like [Nelumbo nucifera]|nr:PREDICTED: BURP domain protein RD22-like [Nelumbo nucifera]